jgi:Zn-dependent protease
MESTELVKTISKFLMLAAAVILAITVHELAHAYVAWKMGDDTAKRMGRISLNPLRHLDPIGSIVFIITAWAGMGIGWARPVPVNYWRMKSLRLGMILVSLAGPLTNILFALLVLLPLAWPAVILLLLSALGESGINLLFTIAYVNAIFAFFNLLPLPPLDGSGVVTGLLPAGAARHYQKIGRYGFIILIALIFLPDMIDNFPNILDVMVRWPAFKLLSYCLG